MPIPYVSTFDAAAGNWTIDSTNLATGLPEEYRSRFLVVAIRGEGLGSFAGERFRSKNVLVVGSGNSGMEIALDLANSSARTSIVVPSPVLPGIRCIEGNKVFFEKEEEQLYDVIVLATGFKSSARQWLKGDYCLLNEDGLAKAQNWKGENGLYCVGMASRGLYGAAIEAQSIAQDIKTLLLLRV